MARSPRLSRWAGVALLGFVLASPAASQAPTPAANPPSPAGVLRLLPDAVSTRHSAILNGQTLDYVATAGTLPLRDKKGDTVAEIFHVAYTVEPTRPDRPVTFVFNGGPGAASAFLHVGALGPRVAAFSNQGAFLSPPVPLVDNPDTWLDLTDLVFVDPVGTGYSRTAEENADSERPFLGVDQDVDAAADFIRLYLARHGRTHAPVFLVGESYGGFRVARLAHALQTGSGGIVPSGVVLVSPALEFFLVRGDPSFTLLPWALWLPSLAAVHLEKQDAGTEATEIRLREVERFALTEYLLHLAGGRQRDGKEISEKLAQYTGLPSALIERHHGRIPTSVFMKEYERAAGRVLSRYDGAISGPDPRPSSPVPRGPDPVLDRAVPTWTTAFVTYVRDELNYRTDLTYRLLNRTISGRWDYGTSPTNQGYAGSLDELQSARSLNPALEVLVVHGQTDLVTPYFASRYLIDQLPPLDGAAPIEFRAYPGGHMMYTRPESRRALKQDAAALYRRALGAAGTELQ